MKKLMILAAVVLMAGLSQAAQVTWTSGALKTPGTGGVFGANIGSGSTLYTAVLLVYSDIGETSQVGSILFTGGTTAGTASGLSALGATTTGTGLAALTTYYAVLTVTKNDNTWKMVSANGSAAAFTTLATGNSTLNFFTGAGFVTAADKMPSVWAPVPEPGTMALFGIGIAVLGLRRKFRK